MNLRTSTSTAQHACSFILDARYKPSTPIEIPHPRGRKPSNVPTHTRPMSPDLIFDMSPVESSLTADCSFNFLSAQRRDDCLPLPGNAVWRAKPASPMSPFHEPFLYPFPQLSPHHINADRNLTQDVTDSPTIRRSPIQLDSAGVRSPMHHRRCNITSAFWHEDELPSSLDSQRIHLSSPHNRQTPKIGGVEDRTVLEPGPELPRVQSSLHAQLSSRLRIVTSPPLTSPLCDATTGTPPMDTDYTARKVGKHRMRRAQDQKQPVILIRADRA